MNTISFGIRVAMPVFLLSGCAGVPNLYKAAPGKPETTLAPKVHDIVEQIACELSNASTTFLSDRNYLIQVQLTLQVDDDINLTPSLSFITPLSNAGTSRALNESLSLGGSRQRTFASTFYFESDSLKDRKCTANGDKLYRLDGNLGLAEIARDGTGIARLQTEMKLKAKPKPLTFASQVKFVVTRAVTSLGPLWTLTRFKGPSGSSGLINGKALTTDTLLIAFAEKETPSVSAADKKMIELLQGILVNAQERNAAARRRAADSSRALENARSNPKFWNFPFKTRQDALASSEAEAKAAQVAADAAARDQEQAQTSLENAVKAAEDRKARSDVDATEASRALINSIILQNLNVQAR